MRMLLAVPLVALAIGFAGATPAVKDWSDADLLSNFIASRYPYLDAAANSNRKRFGVLEAMLDELYDPHSHLTANYRDSWRLPAYDIWAEPRDNTFVVTEVRSGSPAQRAGIRAGDEVAAIDGRAVRDAISLRLPRFLLAPDPAATGKVAYIAITTFGDQEAHCRCA